MKKYFRILIILAGLSFGVALAKLIVDIMGTYFSQAELLKESWLRPALYVGLPVLGAVLFFIFSDKWSEGITRFISDTEEGINKASSRTVLFNTLGISVGIIVSYFLSHIVSKLGEGPFVFFIDIIIYIVTIYLAVIVATKLSRAKRKHLISDDIESDDISDENIYYLDTSVLIDGRIGDFLRTGVLEGEIVVPGFVLSELQHIADSEDDLRREKGRRGLDVLNEMISSFNGNDLSVKVETVEEAVRDNADLSLVELAKENRGKIITLDFNLNKVATAQQVKVINLNDISNSLKMSLVPGDRIEVTINRKGKERQQGVAYLQDGTMIVVEDSMDRIGDTMEVEITSSLQTSAGRMIFAKMLDE